VGCHITRKAKLMARGKLVTIIKEVHIQYEVDAGVSPLSDEQAIDTVKLRMDTGSPLGLLEETTKTTSYKVEEKS